MPSYVMKCCCGATGHFETASADSFVRGGVEKCYERWVTLHQHCPALYAPRVQTSSAPVANGPEVVQAEGATAPARMSVANPSEDAPISVTAGVNGQCRQDDNSQEA